ncbi:response regulator [Aquimarina algiphila]|uniref:Response regulator n=1 Tax=Aquimarina algiphila TaxID=2047982 RepID=A0A554VH26_9FLAO|nr:response regulator [Aquimarina algiphila]TSE06757.1 response regulator [Aquimarina algiphila]
MEKIKYFLLVDDSDATNFFNKTIIQKTECVEEVLVAKNGREALEYIQSGIVPEVLFLDVNMPVMNGWEFLTEFKKLESNLKKSIIVLMLGTTLNEEERTKAENIPEIKEFQEKMLSKEIVCKIVNTYFSDVRPALCS